MKSVLANMDYTFTNVNISDAKKFLIHYSPKPPAPLPITAMLSSTNHDRIQPRRKSITFNDPEVKRHISNVIPNGHNEMITPPNNINNIIHTTSVTTSTTITTINTTITTTSCYE